MQPNSILKIALYSRYFHYFLLWMRRLRIKRNYMIYRLSGWALNWSPGPQSPPEPHVSAARPQSRHMQWTFIHHTLTPMHQSWLQLPFLYQGFIFRNQAVAQGFELLLPPRGKASPLLPGGSIFGVFSVSAPNAVTPCWVEAPSIPSLQPEDPRIRISVCNKSLCLPL